MVKYAFADVRDDLHVLVRMHREAAVRSDLIVIPDHQAAEARVRRIALAADGEVVSGPEPVAIPTSQGAPGSKLRHLVASHCVALIAEAGAAKDAINQTLSAPRGVVLVSCPTGLLQGGVANILARYLGAHPQVRIALEATNRKVDVVDEGIDITIRVRVPPLEDSDLAMRSFGGSQMILVGSPALVAAHGQPQAVADIERMPTLSMGTIGKAHSWHFVDADSKPVEVIHTPCLGTDDLFTLRQAALCGVGIACLPALLVTDDLSSGALVRLLPSLNSRSGLVHAVFPSRRGMVPAVRSLLDSLSEGFAAIPWLVSDEPS